MIYFGPINSGSSLEQLSLPEEITKVVEYKDFGVKVEYLFAFDGKRLRLTSMSLVSGTEISTSLLVKLQIPRIAREVVYEHNPSLAPLIASGTKNKTFLAQLYWAEYVCDGAPREMFRRQLGIARNTANYHLTRFSTAGLIPTNRERMTKSTRSK